MLRVMKSGRRFGTPSRLAKYDFLSASDSPNLTFALQATLLLPLEAAFMHEKITADFVKDHVVLCDGPSRKSAPIVTLSGLRGTLDEYVAWSNVDYVANDVQRGSYATHNYKPDFKTISRSTESCYSHHLSITPAPGTSPNIGFQTVKSHLPPIPPSILFNFAAPTSSNASLIETSSSPSPWNSSCSSNGVIQPSNRQSICFSIWRLKDRAYPCACIASCISP